MKAVSASHPWLGTAAFLVSLLVLFVSFEQSCIMRQAMRTDQRAWVSVVVPTQFPLTGSSLPALIKVVNTGKTPAKAVEGDIVATVLSKGDAPALGDFSIGHPHNRVYAGAIFSNAPLETTIPVLRYGLTSAEPIMVDDTLRQDIANGNRFIIFYGKITYFDVFGVQRWTQFCTGSGSAIAGNLKECVRYNDVDSN